MYELKRGFAALCLVAALAGWLLVPARPARTQEGQDEKGAMLEKQVLNLQGQLNNLQTQVNNLQAALNHEAARAHAAEAALQAAISGPPIARRGADGDGTAASKSYVDGLVLPLADKLSAFSRKGNDIYITGANLYIVNGRGQTETSNGLGNLIIGYNESRPGGDVRTGSHNLVVGKEHNFSSYGSLIAGFHNETRGVFSSVPGGTGTTLEGNFACSAGAVSGPATKPVEAARPPSSPTPRASSGASSRSSRSRWSGKRHYRSSRTAHRTLSKRTASRPAAKPAPRPGGSLPSRPPGR